MKLIVSMFNNLYKIAYGLAILTIVVGFIFLATKSNIYSNIKIDLVNPYHFKGQADIILEDGTTYHKKTPFVITTDRNFHVILNLDNIGMIDNKTLSLVSENTTIRFEVDGKVIYRHFGILDKEKYTQGNTLILVDLPKSIKNNKITMYYENNRNYLSTFELKDVKIGKRINIISHYFLKSSIFDYILLISMLVIFISITSTTNFSKRTSEIEKYFTSIAFLSLSIFFYIFCNMSLSYFILNKYSTFLNIGSHTSLMLIPLYLLSALKQRSSKQVKVQLKLGIFFASFNIVTQYTLVLLDLKTFSNLSNYTYMLILYSSILTFYSIFVTNKTQKNRFNLTALTIVPLLIAISFMAIQSSILGQEILSQTFKWGILIFGAFQSYEFFSFHVSDRDKKIKADLYQKLAFVDRLTGLGNRLALSEKKVQYKKHKKAFFIVLLDINNLKFINDNYGHKYGDDIIKLLSDMLKSHFDEKIQKDIFRIGGDEFLMIYHGEKDLQSQLESLAKEYENSKLNDTIYDKKFGVSFGFEYCDLSKGDVFEKIMHIADRNMYLNKANKKSSS